MEIPLAYMKHANFPEPNVAVNEFLAFNFPHISSEIISSKVARWFSKGPDCQQALLYKYELHIKEGELLKLYFPVHVSKNHWIVGMVNFKKKSIAFADSLYTWNKGPGAPIKFITALQTWLKHAFRKQFKSSLDHVVQDNTYSCGVFTANTIAHTILNRLICNSNYATEEQLKWFIYFASLYSAKSETATPSKDIDMPLAGQADIPNVVTQASKVLAIADLLNPIGDGHSICSATNGYDSDDSA
ncbi:hypothetical protein B0H34DRAFT_797377 [Crassisporium funariophilum]|nr:hypothetical protein B0H34DRAFT_797377 [Crassisporium funariophilum]